jgi:hypothetical protein
MLSLGEGEPWEHRTPFLSVWQLDANAADRARLPAPTTIPLVSAELAACQVWTAATFAQTSIPGFLNVHLSSPLTSVAVGVNYTAGRTEWVWQVGSEYADEVWCDDQLLDVVRDGRNRLYAVTTARLVALDGDTGDVIASTPLEGKPSGDGPSTLLIGANREVRGGVGLISPRPPFRRRTSPPPSALRLRPPRPAVRDGGWWRCGVWCARGHCAAVPVAPAARWRVVTGGRL